MKYNINSPVDKEAVELAYIYLLARNIESTSLLESIVRQAPKIGNLRKNILSSQEYKDNILRLIAIDYYIEVQSQALDNLKKHHDTELDINITILQTCDDLRYPILLAESEKFNNRYAKKWGLKYFSYKGLKKGVHPHHAMLNRIFILSELINEGYNGWVIYLDADSLISDSNYDIVSKLKNLRKNNLCLWLHNVYPEDHEQFHWSHINDGAFAIDLSSPIAQLVVSVWKGIYDNFYSLKDFELATKWLDIIDDQSSLTKIIEIFNIRENICLEQLQGFFAYQVLRQDHQGISSDDELKLRAEIIRKKGNEIYS